ncbi:SBBP repeat-containing protein [Telluribacter sp. SYSU D00476]|uniref:SBBP repeat-containing protein n=1 Tax=Telluribacter sp. SYSU D00476 TaxID=2811430 RepID=UPI001FF3B306|nr:SBBP repeat-containing protein [Telluribacter sp. SYSU D00476]
MRNTALALIGLVGALLPACTDHITDPLNVPLLETTAWGTGGTGFAIGYATAVDPSGNVYVTGMLKGEVKFGDLTVSGPATAFTDAAFVAKYSPTGQVLWVQQVGQAGTNAGLGIAVDGAGNVYVSGVLAKSADYATPAVVGEGTVIVSKYTTDGKLQWAKTAGSTDRIQGQDIAVDKSGNVYITGLFEGTAVFGETTLTARSSQVKIGGREDIFIARLNTNGEYQWARRAGGGSLDAGFGLAVDESGDVYTTGVFSGTTDFGGLSLNAGGIEVQHIFVAKYSGSSGELRWAQDAGSGWGRGIAVDGGGDAYVVGDRSIHKVGRNDGSLQWSQRLSGGDHFYGSDITTDAQGNIFVTGAFTTTLTLAGQTITSSGGQDLFLARLRSDGTLNALHQDGGSKDEVAYGIALGAHGNITVTGYYHSPSTLAGKALSGTNGGLFVAQYNK